MPLTDIAILVGVLALLLVIGYIVDKEDHHIDYP